VSGRPPRPERRSTRPAKSPEGRQRANIVTGLVAAVVVLAAVAVAFYHFVVTPAQADSAGLAQRPEASSPGGLGGIAVHLLLSAKQAQLLPASNDPDAAPVAFDIQPGETASDVAVRLQNLGLIRDASAFELLLRDYGLDRRIEAGHFQLSPAMSSQEIATALLEAQGNDTVLVSLEGWRLEQVAAAVEQAFGTGDEFQRLASQGAGRAPVWVGLPAGTTSLEGLLFPDTYRFDPAATPDAILNRILSNLEARFDVQRRARAAEMGLTPFQVLTLASIVEREAVIAEERPLIAGVFLNRLQAGMLLQADPTVQYALGYQANTGRWWKTPLLAEDLTGTDSPYNTYIYPGLPPGPICNPGLSAIDAVLWPQQSDYLYFVAKGDGSHVFSVTFEEHEGNVARYQGG